MNRILLLSILSIVLASCAPATIPSAQVQISIAEGVEGIPDGFSLADGTRPLVFPRDFGAHEEFRTEWWYYTGNLETSGGGHFGFELTIFRVGLLPPSAGLPAGSAWYDRSLYFAHFAVSDIAGQDFYAFERYARPGPGLAGAQGDPYRVWLEDWSVAGQGEGAYRLLAQQSGVRLDLTLTDEMGVILHGEDGYSRKGEAPSSASYYYSQPRMRAEGSLDIGDTRHAVSGLVWKDHEFSTSVLDDNQVGWDWFSLQFEDGRALMLFQLREREGSISDSSSGTFVFANGTTRALRDEDFSISVQDQWKSPHTGGVYPAGWRVQVEAVGCTIDIEPWMPDQELNFPAVTYWEGAVRFEGICGGTPARGNGYIELTGYVGSVPLP